MNLSHLSCVDDVFQRCLRSTISDVFTDAKREDQRRLKNHSTIATQGFQLKITNVAIVDGYPLRLWVVEPRQETHQCRLSRFFFNDTATTEIYTLSLHDALPI